MAMCGCAWLCLVMRLLVTPCRVNMYWTVLSTNKLAPEENAPQTTGLRLSLSGNPDFEGESNNHLLEETNTNLNTVIMKIEHKTNVVAIQPLIFHTHVRCTRHFGEGASVFHGEELHPKFHQNCIVI